MNLSLRLSQLVLPFKIATNEPSTDVVTVKLNEMDDLFQPPQTNYFSPNPIIHSGIEKIFFAFRSARRSKIKNIYIDIPIQTGKEASSIESKVTVAIQNYCQIKIKETREEIAFIRQQGFWTLKKGLLALAVFLACSTLASNASFLPAYLTRFLGEGFLIAGWVSMWRPVEIFLYEWWPQAKSLEIYAAILETPIQIMDSTTNKI